MIEDISVTILTKNSSLHIRECLLALKEFSEIIVLDNGSTDKTLDIVKSFKNVKLFEYDFIGFGPLKRLATGYATNDWILSVDSDEIITEELLNKLKKLEKNKETVYSFKRLNHYNGRPIKGCGWYPDEVKRLFNKKFTNFNTNMVHESVESKHVELIQGDIKHYSFRNISDLLQKLDKYTELYANANIGKKISLSKPFLSMFTMFIKSYFLKKGFKYGLDGFSISLCNALGAFFKHYKLIEKNKNITISLVITTYNSPQYLKKVLESVLYQTLPPMEIIIADDGSTDDTKKVIEEFAKQTKIPVIHSWQEDKGFRAAKSRNEAFIKATGEYLIYIDGDIILSKNFIKDHKILSERNTVLYGRRVFLTKKLTDLILFSKKRIKINLFTNGIKNRLKVIRSIFLAKKISKSVRNSRGFQTCNFSFFRNDFININGFNEDFEGWGLEDTELCERFLNSNIKLKKVRFSIINYHLWHKENSRDALQRNKNILNNTIKNKTKRCCNGLVKDELN
ncbi:glycosyltransferase family 2 protein [Francisella frigiditurris]|uniref:Glycosyltransferase like 2 family protein n=1 Tax=Francisella frigiditurris TaxID=1542390 RepID=A0A1J0KUN8_9GAMM|nr:glycosyltransferase [Francisella frigiditurris]APC97391.1 glycosyltransferase like 2 family protein [Francisella frigiditurris]